jgi:two-component system, response regulator YesN
LIRVLLVDDEATTRRGLKDFIPWRQLGVDEVRSAESAEDALRIAADFKPDLVISDIRMPNLSGIELARQLHWSAPSCRIVFLSAYPDKENLKQAIDLRVVKFLEKPIKRQEVMDVVESVAAQILEERRVYESRRRQQEEGVRLARQKLAADVLDDAPEETLQARLDLADIDPFAYRCFTSLVFRFGRSDEGDAIVSTGGKERLCAALVRELESLGLGLACPVGRDEAVVHLFSQEDVRGLEAEEWTGRAERAARDAFGRTRPVFVGIGSTEEDVFRLSRSVRGALGASRDLFHFGYGRVSVAGAPPSTGPSAGPPVGPGTSSAANAAPHPDAFRRHLHDFDREGAVATLDAYFRQASLERTDAEKVRRTAASLLTAATRFSASILQDGTTDEEGLAARVRDAETLERLRTLCVDEVARIFDGIETHKESGYIVSRIRDYIEAHYADHDLSIDSIARQVFMSGPYLCHIFKKRTGVTINAHITSVRIERAKDLLKNQMYTVASVSGMVGYTSHDYFTKLFRRHVGLTPSEFRNCCAPGSGAAPSPAPPSEGAPRQRTIAP